MTPAGMTPEPQAAKDALRRQACLAAQKLLLSCEVGYFDSVRFNRLDHKAVADIIQPFFAVDPAEPLRRELRALEDLIHEASGLLEEYMDYINDDDIPPATDRQARARLKRNREIARFAGFRSGKEGERP